MTAGAQGNPFRISLLFPFRWRARAGYHPRMKLIAVVAAALVLNSCNTLIGIGRDTKAGYYWTKGKIQGSGQQQESGDYGAPVY
jgi:predicted small secreted protein